MATPTQTYLEIMQEVAYRLHARTSGTLTAAAAATVTAANYPFKTNLDNADSNMYVGDELYITTAKVPAVAPNPQEVTAYAPSTGILTPGMSYTETPAATANFDIYQKEITRAMLQTAVNRALRSLRYRVYALLSLLPDADMELSGTDSWGTASDATFTKSTADLIYGTQVGNVLNSAVNGYLPSESIDVTPDTGYFVQADLRITSGTANFIAYDETNSAEIDSEDYDDYNHTRLAFSFTTPASCKQITIRLAGEEADADIDWDDVILLRPGARQVPLPDYITERDQLRRVLHCSGQDYADMDQFSEYLWWDVKPDMLGPNQRLFLTVESGIRAVTYLDVVRPYPELSADTDTTVCDRELLVLQAKYELLNDLVNKAPGQEVASWKAERSQTKKDLKPHGYKQRLAPYPKTGFSTPPRTP